MPLISVGFKSIKVNFVNCLKMLRIPQYVKLIHISFQDIESVKGLISEGL